MARDLRMASRNLKDADGTLPDDPRNGKHYSLADDGLALPVKRFQDWRFLMGTTYSTARRSCTSSVVQHIWINRSCEQALVIYFPKLENEEEAAYLASVIRDRRCEASISGLPAADRSRDLGLRESTRHLGREMGEALYPYFLGGSLGWHDFLASTARLFRHDPDYRIGQADPDIVIRNIRESQRSSCAI